jgi:hypothetical protein
VLERSVSDSETGARMVGVGPGIRGYVGRESRGLSGSEDVEEPGEFVEGAEARYQLVLHVWKQSPRNGCHLSPLGSGSHLRTSLPIDINSVTWPGTIPRRG